MTCEELTERIKKYRPFNEQEEADKVLILDWIRNNKNAFFRENMVAHMTASAWVVNKDRSKVLMIYHNIYNSWSWLGGHADGETDLLAVAIREVREEAGIANVYPCVRRDLFSGITDCGWPYQKGQICIQSFASEYYLPSGG